MSVFRVCAAVAAAMLGVQAAPASAQFFLQPVDLSGHRVTGAEPGMVGQELPGATPKELQAALVWNMRAALNVAAMQCFFAPSLLTLSNYNGMLSNHKEELADAYATLGGYFRRVNKSSKAAQAALDQYGTRIYSGFSTVSGQYSFCQTASEVGYEALVAPRGTLTEVAENNMYALRRSLLSWGDQAFRTIEYVGIPPMPDFGDKRCWKDDTYRPDRCGALPG